MANQRNRYKQMQKYVSMALLLDLVFFIFYLIVAGAGIIWLKVILVVLIFAISLCVLGFLYLCREILRKRSLWMSTAAAAFFICTLASVILNFPSPV